MKYFELQIFFEAPQIFLFSSLTLTITIFTSCVQIIFISRHFLRTYPHNTTFSLPSSHTRLNSNCIFTSCVIKLIMRLEAWRMSEMNLAKLSSPEFNVRGILNFQLWDDDLIWWWKRKEVLSDEVENFEGFGRFVVAGSMKKMNENLMKRNLMEFWVCGWGELMREKSGSDWFRGKIYLKFFE